MHSKLKPPGCKRLKLKCDLPHSNFAFKFSLRRYTVEPGFDTPCTLSTPSALPGKAVQVDPIKPMLKARGTERLKL